jgi:hypothetical protein
LEWGGTVYGGDVTSIVFKEFLPDQPELGNPGLIRAQNVLPRDDGYTPFRPAASVGTMTNGGVSGSFQTFGVTKGASKIYAYGGHFWLGSISGGFSTRGGSFTVGASYASFAQYENMVIAVGESFPAHFHTVGAASNFATLASNGTAPPAEAIGVLGQFVVIGSLGTVNSTQRPNVIQWSGVDAPRSWPTPGSATAIAQQAGEQELPSAFGRVQAIHGGDQYAIVLQERGVTRMTYVGPPAVFQFDTISNSEGAHFARGSIRVGNVTYFISQQGFCRTNGVVIEHIGAGKVDRTFWESGVATKDEELVTCGYDPANDLVYFSYPTTNLFSCDKLLIFNPKSGNWSMANQEMEEFVGGSWPLNVLNVMAAFQTAGSASLVSTFTGTAGSAILETGEMEFNEGGRAYVDAVKAHVESSGTAPAIGMRIGTRDDLGTAPSYTSTTGAFARTGFANFRSDAKYHRIELNITGTFEKVTGLEVNARPSGKA